MTLGVTLNKLPIAQRIKGGVRLRLETPEGLDFARTPIDRLTFFVAGPDVGDAYEEHLGALEVALTGRSRTIDLGRATYRAWDGTEATTVFANVASAGMSGAIAQRDVDVPLSPLGEDQACALGRWFAGMSVPGPVAAAVRA